MIISEDQWKRVEALARVAGAKMLDIYENANFEEIVDFKSDNSPLTLADKESHNILAAGLAQIAPQIPLMSEEGKQIAYSERKDWTAFWCVDPLDGTKEFIKKNGDFTVNIALIENKLPIAGLIFVPVKDTMYITNLGGGARKSVEGGAFEPISVDKSTENMVAVRSLSHASPEEDAVLANYPISDTASRGSSLKFCMVAEGSAHVYYRHGPTMEWDTAAGQALVLAAGGKVTNPDGTPFTYNKENLLNGSFLATAL